MEKTDFTSTSLAGTISCPHKINIANYALKHYANFNQERFSSVVPTNFLFKETIEAIYEAHNQIIDTQVVSNIQAAPMVRNNKVLVAFSGGLDSMYQVLYLKEQGYEVILYHVANVNYYTNGKEKLVCEQFAEKFNLPLIISTFKQNTKKDNPYRKYWRENSFKNTLIYSMMLDYCLDKTISNISCGDDLRLDIKDAVVGTNIADAKQITIPFVKAVKTLFNIGWLFVDHNVDKAQRIKKLMEYGCLDLFYSCVNPGRFNQSNHERIQKKFNVQMEQYNCGVCRKCAFHSLLRHYYLGEEYNKEFIDFCWNKICIGADYEFFKPSLPMEIRIKNLIEY